MKKSVKLMLLCLLAAYAVPSASAATVPLIISYQGRLENTEGEPLDTTVGMIFALYDSPTGPEYYWSEQHVAVEVEGGLFSVILGSIMPIPDSVFEGAVGYLGIKIGTDPEISPRIRLTSVPWAFKAGRASIADTARVLSGMAVDADRVDGYHASEFYIPNFLFPLDQTARIPTFLLYTGSGSGLDADFLDGLDASNFLSIASDYGRSGVADNLFEGITSLTDLYVNEQQSNAVTSDMIEDNAIIRDDVSPDFKSPYADTADYAVSVQAAPLDSRYVNEGQNDAVSSNMVQDNTLTRADIVDDFKAPYADTADYANAGAPDNDWQLSVTDGSDSTLVMGGGWGLARKGNTLYGSEDHTHVNLGVSNTTGSLGQNAQYCTVAGGFINTASGHGSTISGGAGNSGFGQFATIGGGNYNSINGYWSTVAGGSHNDVTGTYSMIGGGEQNSVSGNLSVVAGGSINDASGNYAVISGGGENQASGPYATVSGGRYNAVRSYYSTIPGGYGDTTYGDYSMAAGYGVRLTDNADYTLAFGYDFTTSKPHAVVLWDSTSSEYPEIKVGIQHLDPTNIITVKRNSSTDPIADDWTVYPAPPATAPDAEIHELTVEEQKQALNTLLSLPIVTYRERGERAGEKISLFPERIPDEIQAERDNDALSLKAYIVLLHAALKSQQQVIQDLEARISTLESK